MEISPPKMTMMKISASFPHGMDTPVSVCLSVQSVRPSVHPSIHPSIYLIHYTALLPSIYSEVLPAQVWVKRKVLKGACKWNWTDSMVERAVQRELFQLEGPTVEKAPCCLMAVRACGN